MIRGRRPGLLAPVPRLLPALLLLGLLSACTEGPAVTRVEPSSAASPAPGGRVPDSSGLAAAKQAAGIPDCPLSDADAPAVAEGLPDAVLPCLGGGRPVRLAGLRGQPMVINIWAQWCGPCREEAPFLAEVAETNEGDVLILGIDHDDPLPARAIEFARVAAWTYPQLQDRDLVLRTSLGVAALPQTLFVRADGTIAYRNFRPFTSAEQIRELTRQHLGTTL